MRPIFFVVVVSLMSAPLLADTYYCGSRGRDVSSGGSNFASAAFLKIKFETQKEPLPGGAYESSIYLTGFKGMIQGALDTQVQTSDLSPLYPRRQFWAFEDMDPRYPLFVGVMPEDGKRVYVGPILPQKYVRVGDSNQQNFLPVVIISSLSMLGTDSPAAQSMVLTFDFLKLWNPNPAQIPDETTFKLSCGPVSSPMNFASELGWSKALEAMTLPCQRQVTLDTVLDTLAMRRHFDSKTGLGKYEALRSMVPENESDWVKAPTEGAYVVDYGYVTYISVYDRATCELKKVDFIAIE